MSRFLQLYFDGAKSQYSILISNYNPLCILNNAYFDVVDISIKDEPIYELYNGQGGNL
jgi:hypothetical protein